MKKRTIITVLSVVGLLIVAFIAGSVLAQGDVTGSNENGAVSAQAYSQEETEPNSVAQVNGAAAFSSSDGAVPNAINAPVEESRPENSVQATTNDIQSSTADGSLPNPAGAPVNELAPNETAPVMSMANALGGPNNPNYNSNIRYVGSTLKPRQNDVDYTTSGSGGCVYMTGGDTGTVWNTPLTLPEGARVEYLRMYFYDNDAGTIQGWFTKYDLYGGLVTEWGVTSIDGGNNYTTVTISPNEMINYNTYSYVLNMRPNGASANLQFCGFRIYYTVFGSLFLPSILR
jgi:hypothetical protein